MSNHKLKLTLALAAALLSGHSAAQDDEDRKRAQTARTSADLPDGYAVLERHVEAIGGVEANMNIKGVQMIGTFNMPVMGLGGTVDISMEAPNKRLILVNVEGMGLINQGTDGKVAWNTQIPGSPPTMLDEEQTKQQIKEADFYARIRSRDTYTSAETVGVFTHDDVKVYKVRLVDKAGTHSEGLYEVESGLLRKLSTKESPESTGFVAETEFSDYREIKDGVMMPYQLEITSGQFGQTITFTEIRLDPPFLEGTFEAPGAL